MTMFWILVAAVVTAVLIYRVFRSYGKTSGSSIRSEKMADVVHVCATLTIRSLYAAVNLRRTAFSGTSGSGTALISVLLLSAAIESFSFILFLLSALIV